MIDDSTPQLLAYVSELLLAAGAWDVYRVPVQMKKGRTGVQLTVLCAPDRVASLREVLFRETTTIGLHWRMENKMALQREFASVETPWGPVQIKVARWPSGEVPTPRRSTRTAASIAARAFRAAEAGDAGGCAPVSPTYRERTMNESRQIEALLNEVREGRTEVTKLWTGCAICHSRTWASPSWIIIAAAYRDAGGDLCVGQD